MYRTARGLLRQAWPDRPVRLVGVTAERTGTDNFEQLDLFSDPARRVKQEKLDRAADALRARFGEDAVLRAKLLQPRRKSRRPARAGRGQGAGQAPGKRRGMKAKDGPVRRRFGARGRCFMQQVPAAG